MPTRRRNCVTSLAIMFCPSSVISPSKRARRTVSCIRFNVRSKVDFPQPDGPISDVTLLVATPRLTSNKTCFGPQKKFTLLTFMRIGKAAMASRPIAPVWLGVMLKDTAGLTDACILRPRNRDAASQNRPPDNIDNQNQSQQHLTRGPRLPMPILIGSDSVRKNHRRQRRRRLVPAGTPVSVSKGGEQQRRRFSRHARKGQQ